MKSRDDGSWRWWGVARIAVVLCALAWSAAALAEGAGGGDLPRYDAFDPEVRAVTAANLLASERFWPYEVALRSPWRPEGSGAPLPAGNEGVLIRVGAGGRARLDFGRQGLYEVPVDRTDLVERANQVRRGERSKMAPNFVLALGPRLLRPGPEGPRAARLQAVLARRWFLTMFPDSVEEEALGRMAEELRSLAGDPDLLTVLLPQGSHPDPEMAARLRAAEWPASFVMDHLSEAYVPTLLSPGLAPPAVMLQTAEGRVLFEGAWRDGTGEEIRAVLEKIRRVEGKAHTP